MTERGEELPEEAWREITVAEGSQGPRSYLVQRPEGASNQQAEARRNPLGHLPPEPGRQRTPLLSVQRSGGHSPGDPGIRGRLQVAYRNGVRDGEERRGTGRVRDPHLGGLASPRGPVPAGGAFLLSLQQAWGKKMPRITRPRVYRVVREMPPRERFGPDELPRWLKETRECNERARRSHAKRRAALRASPDIPP